MSKSLAGLAPLLVLLLLPRPAIGQLAHDLIHAEIDLSVSTVEQLGKTTQVLFESESVESRTPRIEYTGIVVQGYSTAAELSAQWRTVSATDVASAWKELYVVRSATDGGFLAGYPGSAVLSEQIQVRTQTSDGEAPYIVVAGVFDRRLDEPDSAPKSAVVPKRAAPRGITTVQPPPLITRADWNAGPFVLGSPVPLSNSSYTNMTFHHAAGFTATTIEEGKIQVKAIQDFHQNGRGWSDIGYQFVVDRGGHVYQGRPFLDSSTKLEEVPELALGAHVGGFNTGNIGICLLGCYHPPEGSYCEDQITSESLASYITMFAFLGDAYNIPINSNTLKGHRDFSSTSCPGDNVYALLPSIREEALQAQQFGNEVPEGSVLAQNAPNPFSSSTTIRYFLKEEGVVDVRVFDVNGREVAALVDEFQQADRWRQVSFDASGLSSGVYFCRIRVEGFGGEVFNQTRPLIHVN